MISWKESFDRAFSHTFAITPEELKKWIDPVMGDILKEVLKARERAKIEVNKNSELMKVIDRLVNEKAEMKLQLDKMNDNQLKLPLLFKKEENIDKVVTP
jgi:hypothetical protein